MRDATNPSARFINDVLPGLTDLTAGEKQAVRQWIENIAPGEILLRDISDAAGGRVIEAIDKETAHVQD